MKGYSLFVLAAVFSAMTSLAVAQDDLNGRLGLISDLLGKHPTGGNGGSGGTSGNLQDGRNSRYCCCNSGNQCPTRGGDDGGFGGINPRNKVGETDIGIRIANNPPTDALTDTCPRGTTQCCYSSQAFVDSISGFCRPLGGSIDSGEPWTQGCSENVHSIRNGRKQCGERSFRHVQGLGRGEASPHEFPWTCLILDGSNNFVGSCAIIPERSNNDISRGTRKVLTAAHKLSSVGERDLLKVRVLEYDASGFNPPEEVRHQEYTVVKISTHPRYAPGRFINDVSILTLDKTIDLLSHSGINAACIPTCDSMFDYQFSNGTGTRCWVAGWGRDRKNGNFQAIMHKVDVPIYDFNRCERSLKNALRADGKTQSANRLSLHPSEICAGGETGKDACDGDGGAPLVCQAQSGRWYAVGLVTWGVDCAQTDVPGVYARVSYFKDWIDNTI